MLAVIQDEGLVRQEEQRVEPLLARLRRVGSVDMQFQEAVKPLKAQPLQLGGRSRDQAFRWSR